MNSDTNPRPLPDSRPPVALSVAGSDPSGGAGIQADLKVFAAHRVYGAAAITALTVQNTLGVSAVSPADGDLVRAQLEAVLEDLPVAAAKTGMLGTEGAVRAVIAALAARDIPLVVDPVLISSSGRELLEPPARAVFVRELLPRATVVTPNLPEAEAILGVTIDGLAGQRDAARALVDLGAKAALVTGGHGAGPEIVDVLADAEGIIEHRAPRIDTTSTHGTGCTLSAAICARLAHGEAMRPAVQRALDYVHRALLAAPGLGGGKGPLAHHVPAFGGEHE